MSTDKRWLHRFFVLLALGLLLAACGIPVPPEKAAYVGTWRGENYYLRISQEGRVVYRREEGNGMKTSVQGPIKAFAGDNFEVGIGPASTTFVVSKVPYEEAGHWKMVVDGVELTRSAQ